MGLAAVFLVAIAARLFAFASGELVLPGGARSGAEFRGTPYLIERATREAERGNKGGLPLAGERHFRAVSFSRAVLNGGAAALTDSCVLLARVLPPLSLPGPDSAYYLGLVYFYGDGAVPDVPLATRYFRMAANLGHVEACVAAAYLIQSARGAGGAPTAPRGTPLLLQPPASTAPGASPFAVDPELATAFAFYKRAADAGSAYGAFGAAEMLFTGAARGLGVEVEVAADESAWGADGAGDADMDAAVRLFEAAVGGGVPGAAFYLGTLCEYGAGHHAANYTRAAMLYQEGCQKASAVWLFPKACSRSRTSARLPRRLPPPRKNATLATRACVCAERRRRVLPPVTDGDVWPRRSSRFRERRARF